MHQQNRSPPLRRRYRSASLGMTGFYSHLRSAFAPAAFGERAGFSVPRRPFWLRAFWLRALSRPSAVVSKATSASKLLYVFKDAASVGF